MKTLANSIGSNPVAQTIAALLLFLASLGGLATVAYADQYLNGGVAWGTDLPRVENADVNPLGVNVFLEKEADPAKVEKTLQMAHDGGFKWIRQGFAWNDIEIAGKGDFVDRRGTNWVDAWAKYDRIVEASQKNGIQIIARLDSPPDWARIPGDDIQQYHKGPPNNYDDYGDFVAAVASRYKGKIKYFQIWNEPNLIGEWGGHPVSPKEYTQLLKVAHDRIKQANPDAVIITAALAPTAEQSVANLNDVLFLEGMYREGAAPYFDILSTMLYGLGQPPDERRTDLKRLNFSRPILLRQVMEKNGDASKPIWISEYAWISLPPDFKGDPAKNIWGKSVDEETQARWLVEGYERAAAEWPWMGVMSVWHLRVPDPLPNEPANYFAILHDDFTPRPAYNAIKEYSKHIPAANGSYKTPRDKPLWNAAGFAILYGLFGLLTVASAAFGAASVGRWAEAALDRPRGRFSEAARETARNGAVVVGMALLVGLYYKTESLPLILASLGGWWVLALFKPSVGLAVVAASIPFFWYPKEIKQQHFPIAETFLVLVFGALLTRRVVGYVLPGLGARLHFTEKPNEVALGDADHVVEKTVPLADAKTTLLSEEALEAPRDPGELAPARWPARPITAPLSITQTQTTTVFEASTLVKEAERDMQPKREVQPKQETQPEQGRPQGAAPTNTKGPTVSRNSQLPTRSSLASRFKDWNRQDAFAAPAVALLIVGTFSLLTLADPNFARDSARAYRWTIVEPVLFYFLLTDILGTRRGLWRVADFFVAAAVGVAMYGIWQYVSGSNTLTVQGVSRVFSVYMHPNNLALYLGRVLPFAVCIALFLPSGWRKLLYLAACVPLAATLVLTYSRGAWVGVALGTVIAVAAGLYWRPGRARGRNTWVLYASSAALVLGLALIALPTLLPTLPARIFNVGSGIMRLDIWDSSLRMLADHPIFGVGPDQFLNQFQAHYITPALEIERYTAHPHNLILDYWLTLGIMGLLILLWILWRYFREAIGTVRRMAQRAAYDPATKALAVGLLSSMLDFLIHGLVDNSYFLMDLAMIFWLSCGLMQLVRET